MRRMPLYLLALTILVLSGCSTNPVTGKQQLSLVSESQELNIGKTQYAPMRQAQGGDYEVDEELTGYVDEIGQKLAAVSDRKLPYEFTVLNSSVPNAWALPGGKIAINRGLLTELKSEAELAAVLGHEITHAAARHTASAMSRGTLLQGAVIGAVLATQGKDYAQLAQAGASIGSQLVTQKYGRDAERESDYYGMKYMAKAGYNPEGAVHLQETFVRLSEGRRQDWLSGLFASHPPSPERVENNKKALAEFGTTGITGEERFLAKTAHLRKTEPGYKAYDEARAAFQKGDLTGARQLVNKAVQIEPREGHFYALLGDIEQKNKQPAKAKSYYDKAISYNPNFFYYYLQRGIASEKLGNRAAAKADLETSVKHLPTANAMLGLGQIAESEGRMTEAREYYAKAAESRTEAGKAAYGELVDMDLASNPGKYVQIKPALSNSGAIIAQLSNTTPRDVSDLTITIQVSDANGKLRTGTRKLNGVLKAGEKQTVDLGIRGLSKEQLNTLRVGVTAAKVAR